MPKIPFREIDRRNSPRIVIVPPKNISGKIKAKLINIGEKGVCIFTDAPISKKSFYIEVNLPVKSFSIPVRVVWSNRDHDDEGFFYGLKIENTNSETLVALRKYMVTKQFKYIIEKVKDKHDRHLVLEFAKEVRDYLSCLGELNESLKSENADKNEIQEKVITASHSIVQKGDVLKKAIDNEKLMQQIKKCFRMLASSWVYKSKIMQRGLAKPKGYPGDFETLELIYDNEPITDSSLDLGRFFDIAFLNNPYAHAVRERKNKMREIVEEAILNGPETIKILNLACGGCREIREMLSEADNALMKKQVFLYCLDWDSTALDFSKRMLERSPDNFHIEMLKENIFNFIRKGDFYETKGKMDLIYSIGLADYFPDRILKTMIKNAYSGLKKGGVFVIAHKDKDVHFSHIPPEWFCDWVFHARNEEDLLDMINNVNLPYSTTRIMRDQSGDIFFCIITKN